MELLELVERTLDEVLPREGARPGVFAAVMRYVVGSCGKGVRLPGDTTVLRSLAIQLKGRTT